LPRTEQTVVTDFDEAFGQDVLQEATDKFLGGQGTQFALFAARGGVAKGDFAFGHLDNALVTESHPKDVGSQIFQGRLPITHRLGVHHPIFTPDLAGNLFEQLRLLQGRSKLGSK
jgi:hypothetical protein